MPCFLMFHILVTVYLRLSISFLMSSRFAVAWMCLRNTLKLFYCFGLYVCSFVFLLFNFFTMFTYAMELFGWILICSFMIFISYLSEAFFFSFCDNNKKLLIIATKISGSLSVSFIRMFFALSSSSSSFSKELIVD